MLSAALCLSQFWVYPDPPSVHISCHRICNSPGRSFLCQDGFLVPALCRWHATVRSLEESGCVCHCHVYRGCWYLGERENVCSRYWWMMLRSCAGCGCPYFQGFLWKGGDGCTTTPTEVRHNRDVLGLFTCVRDQQWLICQALSQEHQAGCYRFSRPGKLAAVPGLLPIRKLKRWINSLSKALWLNDKLESSFLCL